MYDLDLKRVKQELIKLKPKTVLIQLPAGLRNHLIEVVNLIEQSGAEAFVWAGSCYGACDLPNYKADLLIQFGHEEL